MRTDVKNSRTYGILPRSEGSTLVEVQTVAADRWQLMAREESSTEAGSRQLLQRMRDAEATVAWLLPNNEVKSFVATFPRLGRKESQRAISGWVAREEGGAPADWAVQWRALRGDHSGARADTQEIFLLYSAREFVDREVARAAEWGLKSQLMLPHYAVLAQFFRKYGPESGDLAGWNLVFLGHDESFLCISTRESLLLTRSLPVDLSEGADPNEYIGRLATEIDRSISFARQTEQNPDIQRVIVCGDQQRSEQLVSHMAHEISVPATFWNLDDHFEGVDFWEKPELRIVLIAAVLAGTGGEGSLGPQAGRQLLGRTGRRRALVGAGALCLGLVPLLVAGGWVTGRVQDTYLDRARSRMEQVADEARAAEQSYRTQRVLLARQQRIRRFLDKNPDYQTVLLRIADLTPREVVYRDLRIRETADGRIFLELEGAASAKTAAQAQRAFLDLRSALAGCEFLSGGEPEQVELHGEGEAGRPPHSTVFAMEYQLLRPDMKREG